MKRREFIKGSAIIGATVATPGIIKGASGMFESEKEENLHRSECKQNDGWNSSRSACFCRRQQRLCFSLCVLWWIRTGARKSERQTFTRGRSSACRNYSYYYFLNGSGHHRDSLNYDFQIGKGDFMMFTSGRGAIHMEETGKKLFDNGGLYHGFQIWLNMPSRYKWIDPATDVHREDKMAGIQRQRFFRENCTGEICLEPTKDRHIVSGFLLSYKMDANCKLSIPTNPQHNAFVYLINGKTGSGRKKSDAIWIRWFLYERGRKRYSSL